MGNVNGKSAVFSQVLLSVKNSHILKESLHIIAVISSILLRNLQFCDVTQGILGKTPPNMKGNPTP